MTKTANQNWNSKLKDHTPIKNRSIKDKANIAVTLYTGGHSVQYISEHMQMSKSRIYEYIRPVKSMDGFIRDIAKRNGTTNY